MAKRMGFLGVWVCDGKMKKKKGNGGDGRRRWWVVVVQRCRGVMGWCGGEMEVLGCLGEERRRWRRKRLYRRYGRNGRRRRTVT
jgi:hypothetical protein